MPKDAYYFPHDSNAKDDPKCVLLIEQLGMEGYGIYWMLIETLREQPDYTYPVANIPALGRRYNTTAEKVKTVVCNYGLFTVKDDKIFFSDSLNRRMQVLEEKRAKRSEAGRLGNAARWKTSQTDRNAITMRSQFIASKVKKSKEKESIGKESMRGKRKPFSPPTPSEVESFFTENGYTAEAARRAFDYYTDANWHDAEGKPVLNWKQKMRGVWFKPEHKQPSGMDLKIPL
ncbi:DUF4373 domain-containing protein [Alistipes indistinctus]|uniref:DUF4373 domain-containing protein n=1 Tax=Alistipes indistinctus TaxID=626932 RepID=UPI00242A9201|nr:DUF4373 domain-containing protein [Alistipes indistinctus]